MQNKWASHRWPYAPTLIARPENPDRSPLAALGPAETANVPALPPTGKLGADTVVKLLGSDLNVLYLALRDGRCYSVFSHTLEVEDDSLLYFLFDLFD